MARSLSSSVSSLTESLDRLDSSIRILDEGVNDFPRLAKVLQTTRHFDLLPEPTLHAAQTALLSEITPSIAHLLAIATNQVEKLSRRQESLRARADLQAGRLAQPLSSSAAARAATAAQSERRRVEGMDAVARAAELRRLVQQRERLQYTVERMELEEQQKKRALRRSIVPP